MTLAPKPWLPANALDDGTIVSLVGACAEAWAQRWWAASREGEVSMETLVAPRVLPASYTCSSNASQTLALALEDTSASKLVELMIAPPAGGKPNDADRALYHQLVVRACADLMDAMAGLFATDTTVSELRNQAPRGLRCFKLCWRGHGPSLDVYVEDALVMHARRAAVTTAAPNQALGALREAIGRQTIMIGASLGSATLDLGELKALSCNDVIVLDSLRDEVVALTINDTIAPALAAAVHRGAAGLELRLTDME